MVGIEYLKRFPAGHGETLLRHTEDVYNRFLRIYENTYKPLKSGDVKRYVFVVGFYSSLLHDIGKATEYFIKSLSGEQEFGYYHSVLSSAVGLAYFYPVYRFIRLIQELENTSKGDSDLESLYYENVENFPLRNLYRLLKFYNWDYDLMREYVLAKNYKLLTKYKDNEEAKSLGPYVFSYIPSIIYAVFYHHSSMGSWNIDISTESQGKSGIHRLFALLETGPLVRGKGDIVGKMPMPEMRNLVNTYAELVKAKIQELQSRRALWSEELEWLFSLDFGGRVNELTKLLEILFRFECQGKDSSTCSSQGAKGFLNSYGALYLDGVILCNIERSLGESRAKKYILLRTGAYGVLTHADWFASSGVGVPTLKTIALNSIDENVKKYLGR